MEKEEIFDKIRILLKLSLQCLSPSSPENTAGETTERFITGEGRTGNKGNTAGRGKADVADRHLQAGNGIHAGFVQLLDNFRMVDI